MGSVNKIEHVIIALSAIWAMLLRRQDFLCEACRTYDVTKHTLKSRREICVDFRTFRDRMSRRENNKIQREKQRKSEIKIYFADFTPLCQLSDA